MSGTQPRIDTERLSLRPLSLSHLDAVVALDADPEVRRHLDQDRAPSRDEVLARMPRLLQRYGDTRAGSGEPAFWAAVDRRDGTFCGWFHLRPLPEQPASLDLGYRLRRERWSQGLATEGGRALVERAFRTLGAERVVAHTLEANIASRRVLEKLGLRESGRYLYRGVLPAVAYVLERDQHLAARS